MQGSNTGSTIVASGASLNIEGSDSKRLSSYTLDNQGTINFQTTELQFSLGGIINNQGQFNSIGPGEFGGRTDQGSGTFNNQGIFTRSGEGSTIFSFNRNSNVAFNNSGIVNVTEGTLALSSLDTINTHSGEFIGEGTLEFGRVRGTHNFIENSSLTVNNVRITGATANFNGTHDTGVNTNFSLIGGTIAGEGTLTLNGPSSWSGGTMGGSNTGSTIVASGASLNIEGSDSKRLRSYTLDNQGTINFQTTQLQFGGGIINNQGQFNSIGPGEISGANGSGIFNNQGIFTRSGEGTTLFSFDGSSGANVAFNNSGIVNVTEGTLALSSLDTINTHSGEFIGEGTLEFGRVRGTHNFIENSSLTVNNVRITGATANFNGTHDTGVNTNFSLIGGTIAGEGTLTLNGPSSWSGGSMRGSGTTIVASGASLNIEEGSQLLARTLDNQGTINFQTTELQFGGGIINNQGQFNSIGPGEFNAQSGNTFNNQGIFTRSGEGITLFSTFSPFNNSFAFNNSGTVNVTEGTLALNSGYVQTAGTTILNGGTLTSNRTLDIQGGQLAGFGTFTTNVDNAGLINPGVFAGDLKTLNITGDYEETDTANINIEIGNLTEFDRVFVDGAVIFDGTLNVSLIDSFTPIVGQSFEVMNYGSYTGELDFTGLNIGGGLFFRPEFTGDASTSGSLTLFVEKLAPTANDDIATTEEDLALTIPVAELLSNDSNTEGDPTLTITGVADAVNGTVELDNTNVIFTPNADFNGDASFTYSVADGNGATDTATVNVTVTPVNDSPVAVDDSYSTNEDTTLNVDAVNGVLVNDSDVDGDSLSVTVADDVDNGILILNDDGSFDYTPNINFNGVDSFTYQVSDGNGGFATAAVNVTVTADDSEPNIINGTPGRDNLLGTGGDDIITGDFGADRITGGAGDDLFVYNNLRDAGDIITDFTIGEDTIDFSNLLSSLDISFAQIGFADTSRGTAVTLDANNSGIFRNFILVQDVNADSLNNPDNFIFSEI